MLWVPERKAYSEMTDDRNVKSTSQTTSRSLESNDQDRMTKALEEPRKLSREFPPVDQEQPIKVIGRWASRLLLIKKSEDMTKRKK